MCSCARRCSSNSLDAWVFVQPTLVNARKREVVRMVRDRQVIVDSIARLMGQLGLKRRAVDGGDASRALLEVKRLREAAADTGQPQPAPPIGR